MFVNLFNEPVGLAVLQEVLAQDLPVHGRSSVLRHHDDGSSEGGLCTHEEVRQDEWVVIPVGEPRNSVEREPDRQEGGLPDDELPGSHNVREHVCCALPPSTPPLTVATSEHALLTQIVQVDRVLLVLV